ncbi:MAG: hypothetical protein K8S87_01850 [Planctomycetes bacterium]|nr:hypothetical protein [Planctomycetota bacterium]
MSTTTKITSVVSALILILSGIMFIAGIYGSSISDTNNITNVHVEQRNNLRITNEITRDISDIITDYNDYKSVKENQLEGDFDLISTAVKQINSEILNHKDENESFRNQITYLSKDAELLNTSTETAIATYLEEKKIPDDVIQPLPKDDKEDETNIKPDETKPDDTIKEKPEDKENKEDPVKVGADSVILKRPAYLPKAYFWPLTQLHKNILMSSANLSKTNLFNYFKAKIDNDGNFIAFNKMIKPFHHIGKKTLAYSIFAQESNTDVRDKILVGINSIRNSDNESEFFSSEIAFTVIGIVYAKMNAQNKLANTSAWKPLEYDASKDFNETETKIINWAIKAMLSRQTDSGGFSNFHLVHKELYDYDVLTTSLVLYALSQAYHSGFTKDIKDIALINGVNFLLKMQNKQVLSVKCALLDKNEHPFKNVNLRGWGFNYNAKPSVRTTALCVAAISKVMQILHAASQKHDELIKTYKSSLVDGFSYIAKSFVFSDDFYTIWAVVQACASAGISIIGEVDIYSEIMTYFADKNIQAKINGFSFSNACFAYWSIMWCKKDQGFFKPMKIADYAK